MGTENPPFVSSFKDRHGKLRYRFRRRRKTVTLPAPDAPGFEAAYQAALNGQPRQIASVTRIKTAAHPRSLRAAWQILITDTQEWKELGDVSKGNQTGIAERFLTTEAEEGDPALYGDLPIPDMRRRHVKAIVARWHDERGPHAASHVLRLLKKLCGVALDQEWIENDPTYRVKFRPKYKGWKAWPQEIRDKFEKRWPIGTRPRTAYAMALLFGHRRSDVAHAKWESMDGEGGSTTTQRKTGKTLWLPILDELAAVLDAIPRDHEYILTTQYGHPYSEKSLTGMMADWTKAAGIPKGYTLHGLRKSLGKWLAERGATTKQIMAILGHKDMKHTELYTEEAEQRLLAEEGMKKIGTPKLKAIDGGAS